MTLTQLLGGRTVAADIINDPDVDQDAVWAALEMER